MTLFLRMLLCAALAVGCSDAPPSAPPLPAREAGFLVVPPRKVEVHGTPVAIDAEARLFYDFTPAETEPETRPIFVLGNGFSARIVRAFGTGPVTVANDGSIESNPSSLTRLANLVYVDPRQSGFSYDVVRGRAPSLTSDCGSAVFNEYVDAADVLLATLAFLDAHPRLRGPVYWVGESYAAVRIQWILAFVRGRFELAPYDDPTLRAALARAHPPSSLAAGQILLQPWLVGRAQSDAITNLERDPEWTIELEKELGATCAGQGVRACAKAHGRSLYDVRLTEAEEAEREMNAARAHVTPSSALALFGMPLDAIDGLRERKLGFKCNRPDVETPDDAALVQRFGALPRGQSYFIPWSPLQPDKSVDRAVADWWSQNLVGYAFVDALRDVPTFLTDGALDLVAPARVLPRALSEIVGEGHARRSADRLAIDLDPQTTRTVTVGSYPNAGHMITIDEATRFSIDVASWVAAR